jgi:type IV pilus assembly protein PilX
MKKKLTGLSNQRGVVLVIGLVMMLLLTIIGMASIRGSDLQERMAGNSRDRNLAFQSAEAALRTAELILQQASLPSFGAYSTNTGYYQDLNVAGSNSPADWVAEWETKSVELPAATLEGVSKPPRYVIEEITVTAAAANPGSGADQESLDKIGGNSEYYRITSRGLGGTQDAEVILQSTYNR